MDVIVLFVPFIVAFGMYCANDPLSRRFMDDLTRGDEDA
jgi:hypothetical protein